MGRLSEKASFINGLIEGLDFSTDDSKAAKVLLKMADLIEDLCEALEEAEDRQDSLEEYVEELDDDLGELEEYIYDEDEDDEDDEDDDYTEDDFVEIECPHCKETVYFDSDALTEESLICPNCNKPICEQDD